MEYCLQEGGTIDTSSRRLGANEGRIGGADGDKTHRRQTSQNRLQVFYHVLIGSERTPRGVALMWKEDNPKFEVESVLFVTFQLATGDERRACDACPPGCKPIVLGDLNINFGFPRDKQEEVIVDLLDIINLIDTLRRYRLQMPL